MVDAFRVERAAPPDQAVHPCIPPAQWPDPQRHELEDSAIFRSLIYAYVLVNGKLAPPLRMWSEYEREPGVE